LRRWCGWWKLRLSSLLPLPFAVFYWAVDRLTAVYYSFVIGSAAFIFILCLGCTLASFYFFRIYRFFVRSRKHGVCENCQTVAKIVFLGGGYEERTHLK